MNRMLTALFLSGLLALPGAVMAEDPSRASDERTPPAGETNSSKAKPDAASAKAKPIDSHCLRETGTHIRPRKGQPARCAMGPGRVYSRDDIARTGEADLSDALRKLDPSIH